MNTSNNETRKDTIMYEITNLAGKVIDTCDYATASRLYGSVQYGWRKIGSSVVA